jgi:hypothetical protein
MRRGKSNSEINEMLQAAFSYAKRGWPVIPLHTPAEGGCSCKNEDCRSVGKHPRTRNGFYDGTTDKVTIEKWWETWPDANIGIVTGIPSGLVVFDADSNEAERLIQNNGIPITPQVQTGKGVHHYLEHPGDRISCLVNSKLGLDVRADGGYVVAPPSLHESGKRYVWAPDLSPSNVNIAPMLPWMLEYVRQKQAEKQKTVDNTCWQAKVIKGVEEGERNNMCAKLSGLLIRMEASETDAIEFLNTWNERNKPSLKTDEIIKTYYSVLNTHDRSQLAPRTMEGQGEGRLVTLGDIFRMEVELPPPVIDGLLDDRDSLLISGSSGLGKSLITLEIAIAVTSGKKLFGRFEVCQSGPVLLVQSENTLKATKTRLNALLASASNPNSLELYKRAIDHISTPMIGKDIRHSGDLLDAKFTTWLQKKLFDIGAKLLVLDPLISYHKMNENDNVVMRTALDRLTALTSEVGAAVIVVHHHGKAQYGGMNQARGATAIVDWARGILTLNRVARQDRLLVKCEHTKHGNFPKEKTLLLEVDGPRIFPAEPDMACSPSQVAEALEQMGGEAKSQNELVKKLEDTYDISRRTAQEAIKTAEEYGCIRCEQVRNAKRILLAA